MTKKNAREAVFARRIRRLPRDVREGANMWLSYLVEARRYRAAGNLRRVAWCLDGAAACRAALPEIRKGRGRQPSTTQPQTTAGTP